MRAGILAPAHGESDEPQDEEDGGGDPEKMERKSRSKKDQYEQKSKNKQHDVPPLGLLAFGFVGDAQARQP